MMCLYLFNSVVSAYPAILTTHVRLPEQHSESVISAERSLSAYIYDLHCHAVAIVGSEVVCPEWELACRLCMMRSLEAIFNGDHSLLDAIVSDVGTEEAGYDLFAEGEDDDGV